MDAGCVIFATLNSRNEAAIVFQLSIQIKFKYSAVPGPTKPDTQAFLFSGYRVMWQLGMESAYLSKLSATTAAEQDTIIYHVTRLLSVPHSTALSAIISYRSSRKGACGYFHKIELPPPPTLPSEHGSHSDTNSSNLLPFPKLRQ